MKSSDSPIFSPGEKGIRLLSVVLLLAVGHASPANAQDLTYDRYAAVYAEDKQPSALQKISYDFLTYPFELIRWPLNKTLNFIEKNHIDKKVQWGYDTLQNRGLTPHIGITSISNIGAGLDVDFVRLAAQKQNFPDLTLKSFVHWTDDVRFLVGSKAGFERIADTDLRSFLFFDYEDRPQEHFYGIGPDTSAGDGAVFGREQTRVGASAGFSPDPTFGFDLSFIYQNVNISGGHDGGRGQRGQTSSFSFERTPGIFGDSILTMGAELVHDTRNQKDNSTAGGRRALSWSYNEGLNSSESRYFKYEAEISHYVRLGSDRRVFVARFYGEHNDEINEGRVPFHQMAKLGGFGRKGTRLSETLRGYDFNRFYDESALLFNLEYRYTIWEYREFKLDTVLFLDEGQVFDEFSNIQFKDFRESYGLGFRLSLANVVLLSLELAHGDEGTNFYVKSYAPFG